MEKVKIVEMGRDIPRWRMINNKKYFFYQVFHTKTEADQRAKSLRKDGVLTRIHKHKPFIFGGVGDYKTMIKRPLRYSIWVHNLHKEETKK